MKTMAEWFWYAIAAAILYSLHQVFTKLASQHIGDGVVVSLLNSPQL